MTTKIYLIEAAGGATPMYTWMSGEEIIKELTSVTKTKYKLKNEQKYSFVLSCFSINFFLFFFQQR